MAPERNGGSRDGDAGHVTPWTARLATAILLAVAVTTTACGDSDDTAGSASGVDTTSSPTMTETTVTETSEFSETTETTTEDFSSEESTTEDVSEDEYTEEEYEDYGEDEYVTDWDSVLPGVWVAAQPYGGEELWTFNGNTGGATWNFWPRGVGVGNPLDNGVPAPINIGHLYSVDGDTLTVSGALSSRVYDNLTEIDSDCFSADFDGDTITFCRWN
jgi:hypothetical protein